MRTAFVDGKIYVEFYPEIVRVSAMVVKDDKVIFAGDDETAKKIADRVIDLKGKTVLPGFIDAHMHLDWTGMSINNLDLRGIKSIREMKSKLKDFSKKTKDVIVGWGWDQEMFAEGRWPNKSDIDSVVKNRSVFLSRLDGHAGVANSHLLDSIGLKSQTGVVVEADYNYTADKISGMVTKDTKKKYLIGAMDHMVENGVTSVGFVSCSKEYFDLLEDLDKKGKVAIRIHAYVNPEDFESLKNYKDTEKLKLKGIKLFTDGSMGSRTALLSQKYQDFDTYGEQVTPLHVLKKYSKDCESTGRSVAIHAIGDSGMDIALSALEDLGPGNRIEHCAIVRDDQLEKFGGINLVVQPHFVHTDFWTIERVGVNRARWVYRFWDLMKKGINVSFSTDSPVEPVNPFLGIYSAVTRGEYENIPLSKYTKDQKLSAGTALHCYTKGSAIALGESTIGSLREGSYADFVIVDQDPIKISVKLIDRTKVEGTYVDGIRLSRD